jgi:DNA-binding MarR family transcriptional regulator
MPTAAFDSLIASTSRLRILTALVSDPTATIDFVSLRSKTGLTDGNLSTHTRRLEAAGLVRVEKRFQERKPVTHVHLTAPGRRALEDHARELLRALQASEQIAHEAQAIADEKSGASAEGWID